MTHFRVKTPQGILGTNYVPGILNAMDKLFSEDFQSAFVNNYHPAANIIEKEKNYEIVLMAPGLNKTDFNIAMEGNLLTISYEKPELVNEKPEEKTETVETFIRKEFSLKSFSRSFTVNEKLNPDDITATYENGLLTVNIPKVELPEAKIKTININ